MRKTPDNKQAKTQQVVQMVLHNKMLGMLLPPNLQINFRRLEEISQSKPGGLRHGLLCEAFGEQDVTVELSDSVPSCLALGYAPIDNTSPKTISTRIPWSLVRASQYSISPRYRTFRRLKSTITTRNRLIHRGDKFVSESQKAITF